MDKGKLKPWLWLSGFSLLITAIFAYVVLWNYFTLRYSAVVFMEKKLGIYDFDVREVSVERYFLDSGGHLFIYLDHPLDFDDLDERKVDYKRFNPETSSDDISPEEVSTVLARNYGFDGSGFESLVFPMQSLGSWSLCPKEMPLSDGDIPLGCVISIMAKDGRREVFIWISTY